MVPPHTHSWKTRVAPVAPARKASVLYPIMGIWGCFPVNGMYRSPLLKAKNNLQKNGGENERHQKVHKRHVCLHKVFSMDEKALLAMECELR